MGLFKQFKDMTNMVAQAPGLINQAQQTAAAAQAYGAQQQAAYAMPGGHGTAGTGIDPTDPRLAPIAGVDLPLYARICKGASNEGLNADGLVFKAQSYGVSPAAWTQAATGWPTRMRGDTQLAVHYGNVYGQV